MVKEIDFAGHGYGDKNDIIQQLLIHFENLFSEETKEMDEYRSLKRELEKINTDVRKIGRTYDGFDAEEAFNEAHPKAEEAMKILQKYLPILLKNEPFFSNSFFS